MARVWTGLLAASLCVAVPAGGAAAAGPALERQGRWAAVNGALLRYELTGSGASTLVLIHDPGLNLEAWDEVIPTIQPGRRILRYDLKGMGLSEKVHRLQTIEEQMDDLKGLLDKLGIKGPVVLIGSTSSAALALKFAGAYPDRVKAVVAITPNVRLKVNRPPLNPALASGRDMREVMAKEGVRAFVGAQMDWLYPPEVRTPDRFARFMGSQVAQDPTERALFMEIKNSGADVETDLPKVRCSTLLAVGSLNSSYTADEWRTIAAVLPRARLEMIRTGHYAAIESPELLAPVMQRFLRRIK